MALRGAVLEVNRGIEIGRNIQSNLAAQNDKLRKVNSTNDELFGDLSLGHGLIGDLEKRKNRERLLCKFITILGLSVMTVLVVGKILLR